MRRRRRRERTGLRRELERDGGVGDLELKVGIGPIGASRRLTATRGEVVEA